MFRMVSPLPFGILFPEQGNLDVDFLLRLGLQLAERYELLLGRFVKATCLWIMVQLRVASLTDMLKRDASLWIIGGNSLRHWWRMGPVWNCLTNLSMWSLCDGYDVAASSWV